MDYSGDMESFFLNLTGDGVSIFVPICKNLISLELNHTDCTMMMGWVALRVLIGHILLLLKKIT